MRGVVLHFCIYGLILTSIFSCRVASEEMQETKRPNILFILADDLGYFDLSCMGSQFYETPNIDRFAANGMVFTNGYAACRVCSPSRASILNGQFPARHGITDYIGAASGEVWRTRKRHTKLLPASYVPNLPKEDVVLPEALKKSGYKTFFAGKWHLGDKGSWPEDHGFDVNIGGYEAGLPKGGYFSPYENPNLPDGPDGENLDIRLAQETVRFMKENKDTTFFAYLSFYAVHSPIQTTQDKWQKYRDKAERMGIAENGFKMGKRLPYRLYQDNPVYAGLVESMDYAVGIVLDALKELELEDNTIVVFTSDNGGVLAGDASSTSNLPLKGGKGRPYEGGIREPYFISVPWMDIKGKKSEYPASGVDFYPTLLELAGLDQLPEYHVDGISLVPIMKGGSLSERSLIWHYPHYGNQGGDPSSIIRKGDWKLIHFYEDGHQELYNLAKDLAERENIIDENKDIANRLNDELFAFLHQVGASFPTPDSLYSKKLESEYLQKIRNEMLPKLESQRKEMLSKSYMPNRDWWGSKPTMD